MIFSYIFSKINIELYKNLWSEKNKFIKRKYVKNHKYGVYDYFNIPQTPSLDVSILTATYPLSPHDLPNEFLAIKYWTLVFTTFPV